MTTINSYSVSLAMDASSYISNSSLSRKETSALIRDINRARSPADNYKRALDRLDTALAAGAINQRTYNRLLQDAKQRYDSASSGATKHASVIGGLQTRLLGISAAYLSVNSAFRAASWSIKLAADAEQASLAFEVMTKDAQVAGDLLNDLKSFAATTPFQLPEIIQSGRQLLAFGITADDVKNKLRVLGDIAAGTGTPITELAEVIGKMNVQGRIMSEDLNQLAGRGINVFSSLAEQLGTTKDKVKDFASKGQISFAMLDKALSDLAANQFGDMMARQAETAAGKWSTLNDQLAEAGRHMGEILLMANKQAGGTDSLGSLLGQFTKGLSMHTNPEQIRIREMRNRDIDDFAAAQLERRRREKAGIYNPASAERAPIDFRNLGDTAASILGGTTLGQMFGAAPAAGGALMQGFQGAAMAIIKADNSNTDKVVKATTNPELFKSLEVGTQEAYDFLTHDMNEQFEQRKRELEQQAKRDEEMKAIAKEGNDLLKELAKVARETKVGRLR